MIMMSRAKYQIIIWDFVRWDLFVPPRQRHHHHHRLFKKELWKFLFPTICLHELPSININITINIIIFIVITIIRHPSSSPSSAEYLCWRNSKYFCVNIIFYQFSVCCWHLCCWWCCWWQRKDDGALGSVKEGMWSVSSKTAFLRTRLNESDSSASNICLEPAPITPKTPLAHTDPPFS